MNSAVKRAFLVIGIAILTSSVFADTKVDDFVNSVMKAKQIPGVALLVVQNGKIVVEKGYGYSNLEHMVPVKPETIFQSGSVGKQFTAMAVMMLVDEGKVQLDDPVSKYLPETPDTWKNIKVRNLLSHTSGLGDYPSDFDFRKDYNEDQLWEIVKKTPLNFQPGDKWDYSNLGFLTLGILIHKVSGQFYGDFLHDRIFQPLGMNSTRIINEKDIIPNRSAGYELVKGEIKNQDWVSPTMNTTADGSLYFNIVDLAKWDAALYAQKLVSKSSFDAMWTAVKLNNGSTYPYGFAWDVTSVNGHRLLEHGGAWQGFTTHVARYVDDKLSVIVLTNLAGANPEYLAHGVAGLYLPAVALAKHTKINLNDDQLKAFAGEYKFDSGQTVQVSAAPGKLILQTGESTKHDLLPESPNSFFIEMSETTISFDKDTMIWHSGGGQEEKAQKVK